MRTIAVPFAIGFFTSFSIWAQGPLNPPGAPAPTLKTLDQVEARTPVDDTNTPGDPSATFIINAPGSYYLTDNVDADKTIGVRITAAGVTLDLNGFEIFGTGSGGIGIRTDANRCRIGNGMIRDVAFGILGPGSQQVSLSELTITGISSNAVHVNEEADISHCTVENAGGVGIQVAAASAIRDCVIHDTGSHGIYALVSSTIEDNVLNNIDGDGIRVGDQCVVQNNLIDFPTSGGPGIHVTGEVGLQDCRVEANTVLRRSVGLKFVSARNYADGNIVKGNVDNYDFAPGNQLNLLLSELPEQIDWPAKVVLAGSLIGVAGTNGITVGASDVTIDLDGHTLEGVSGSVDGIHVASGLTGIAVKNGVVRNWDQCGIDARNATNGAFSALQLIENCQLGSGHAGLAPGSDATVHRCDAIGNKHWGFDLRAATLTECTARGNLDAGFRVTGNCTFSICAARNNGGPGFDSRSSTLIGCSAQGNQGVGIINSGGIIDKCDASGNQGNGITLGEASIARDSVSKFNIGHGISCFSFNRVIGNTCHLHVLGGTNKTAGIFINGPANRIEGNQLTFNNFGLQIIDEAPAMNNLVIQNTASANATNYIIGTSNRYGPIIDITAGGTAAVNGSSAPDTTTTTHPWANFSH